MNDDIKNNSQTIFELKETITATIMAISEECVNVVENSACRIQECLQNEVHIMLRQQNKD